MIVVVVILMNVSIDRKAYLHIHTYKMHSFRVNAGYPQLQASAHKQKSSFADEQASKDELDNTLKLILQVVSGTYKKVGDICCFIIMCIFVLYESWVTIFKR